MVCHILAIFVKFVAVFRQQINLGVMIMGVWCRSLLNMCCSWCRERRGVHSAGIADRVRYGGGGVLAVGQLLVAGAGGHPGGRLTRGGGRVHARVAPAVRGVARGLAVARAAAARAAAGARARVAACRPSLLPRRLPATPLRQEDPKPSFLTGSLAALLSHTWKV